MEHSATVIKADGTITRLDHRPTLEEAQEIVGGWVEFIHAQDVTSKQAVTLVVNEEGRLRNFPTNWAATNEYWSPLRAPLVGNVIVLTGWRTLG